MKSDRCGAGHRLTEANVYRSPSRPNVRNCRKCRTIRNRRRTRADRYTLRGLDWAKQKITMRAAQRVARYYAGRLLLDAVDAGWAPADLQSVYGTEGLQMIREALLEVSWRLESTGDPKGRPTPTLGRKPG